MTDQKTDTNKEKIETLLTRGVENIFPNKDFLEQKLSSGERLSFYVGIDPTGDTLHLGHIIPLRKLKLLQELGHKVILLIGDFTARIGDPTDKSATRKQLSAEEVMQNQREFKKQASRFISFEGENAAEFKYNSEWLAKMNFEDVIKLASEFTVQQMLERDMFAKRMQEGKPIHIHEFMYPLMQGYDSVAMDVDGEIGGNDQTFNMLAGRTLMKNLNNKEKIVIATKLLVDPTGKKMGKTEGNIVALNQTPEDMFGKVMSWSDELIIPGLEILTDMPGEEIESIKEEYAEGKSNPKEYKITLAKEIIRMIYKSEGMDVAEEKAQKAAEAFTNTFSKGGVPEDVTEIEAKEGDLLVDLLLASNIIESKTEWRRLVEDGAVKEMDKDEKISDPNSKALTGTYKIGKRRFIKIKN